MSVPITKPALKVAKASNFAKAVNKPAKPSPAEHARIPVTPQVQWLGWSATGTEIIGQFRRLAADADPAPILVEAYASDRLMLRTFATPADNSNQTFAFRGAVRQLIERDNPVTLRPRLNECELDQPLTLDAQSMGVTGYLDPNSTVQAAGWAVDLTDRARRIQIELRGDGHILGHVAADAFRADLLPTGLSDGHSGFEFQLPAELGRQKPVLIQAYLAGTETELVGSPCPLQPPSTVNGYFDVLQGHFAEGWAVNMQDPTTPLAVEAVCDGEVIGAGLANLHRPDVEQAGMPTAWCGFRFMLERPFASLSGRDIEIRVPGTKDLFSGSPRQITEDQTPEILASPADAAKTPAVGHSRRESTQMPGGDPHLWCPRVWDYVLDRFGIASVLDLGSGSGSAALYFQRRGMYVCAVDPDDANISASVFPVIKHDVTTGPFISRYDLIHCQNLVEHIAEQAVPHLMQTFACAKVTLITHALPDQPGQPYANQQPPEYWIKHMAEYSMTLLEEDTRRIRLFAQEDGALYMARSGMIFANRNRL